VQSGFAFKERVVGRSNLCWTKWYFSSTNRRCGIIIPSLLNLKTTITSEFLDDCNIALRRIGHQELCIFVLSSVNEYFGYDVCVVN
jgi:hypothetical protein